MIKKLLLALFVLLQAIVIHAQDFEWAYRLDIPTANEVAGMDIDNAGNVCMAGVYGADASLPYDGHAYVTKADPQGAILWTRDLGENIFFGDISCAGDFIYLVVQSTGDISLDGVSIATASANTYMAVIVLNQSGNYENVLQYPDKHGQFANLDYHDGTVALQCRGQFNSGQQVIFFEGAGVETSQHDLSISASITEVAYYNGWTYLVGGATSGQGVSIDNVSFPPSDQDGLTFILAFDPDFVAQWGHADDALNSQDSQVEAGESGIYSYQVILLPGFQFSSAMWKFNFDGLLIDTVTPPTFSNSVTLYPDLALSECHLVLFTTNSFNNNSHEVIIYDHDLTLLDEKEINGASNLYSGQVSIHDNQIYVAHVHSDDLDFNGEVEIIDALTDAIQYPYLAKVGVGDNCGPVELGDCMIGEILYELHDCVNGEFYVDIFFEYEGVSNNFTVQGNGENYGTFEYGAPFYTVGPFAGNSSETYELVVIDSESDNCSNFVTFQGQECPVGDCAIVDFEMLEVFCDTDSTYGFIFDAVFIDPGNDFFDLWINNEFIGFYAISELPLYVTGISPRDGPQDIIKLCVNDNPECCFVLEYDRPDCLNEGDECAIVDFEMWEVYCDTDTTYSYIFDAVFVNPGNDFFDLWINNEFIGFYAISELPLTVSGISPRDAAQDIIKLCVNDNLDCCYLLEYERPACLNEGDDCAIVDFEMWEIYCDSDTTYTFIFDAEFINPGNDFFDLWINNEPAGFYAIAELPITVSGISPRDAAQDIIQFCVNDTPDCCYVLEYDRPQCIDGFCTIQEVEVFGFECDTDSTYSFSYNAQVNNSPSDFIDVWINGDYLGFFEVAELPLQISGVVPSGGEEDFLGICASDLDACCGGLEFTVPDCIVDIIPEFQLNFEFYPNPVIDWIYFQNNQLTLTLKLYDITGKEVINIPAFRSNALDLSAFDAGVYFLHLSDDRGRSIVKRLNKE